MSENENNGRRFFIVTVGRTGSSLLGAILSDAGADFGIPKEEAWEPSDGAYEHPELDAIVQHFQYMTEIGNCRPNDLIPRIKWTIARHRAKAGLKALLPKATYLKGELYHLVHWSSRLGFHPTVIVSFRRFGEVLQSLGHLHPQPPSYHAEKYDLTMRNGLAFANIYGGCAIDYQELVDLRETGWALALSQSTGLTEESLLSARGKLVSGFDYVPIDVVEPFPTCQATYEKLCEVKGSFLPPSRATIRALKNKGE